MLYIHSPLFMLIFFLVLFVELIPHYGTQAGLELRIPSLTFAPKPWDYNFVPPCLALISHFEHPT